MRGIIRRPAPDPLPSSQRSDGARKRYLMRALLVAWILLALIVLVVGCARVCPRDRGSVRLPRVLRRWRPRTPDDCAHCRLTGTGSLAPPPPPVLPWRQGRSRRGAPRRIATEGYACRRPCCRY